MAALGFVSGFAPALGFGSGRAVSQKPSISMMAKSESVPFLEAPSKLNGSAPGDIGFDPLYLSDYLNFHYCRASEIKHGRICMLACLGWIVQELVQLPGAMHSETHAIAAIYKAPVEAWWQIIAFMSLCELATFKATYDSSSTPGAYGFDPMGLGKSDFSRMQLAEIKNGRLAMMGFIGMLLQQLVTGQGVVEQLTNFKPLA
uniref:Uncharacterized protein n=1 Tax=Compsopogon caeruleus TaxID=31354 RepID=A0A7S1TAP5_9RHOD|mmetsp:Transcript_14533/g.29690  ORF Transcript_14533/g.29690 Transcript_14533/m.29690 type:complete len:202 (+) Transcript_14533:131-736(+)|eukprot:CAMPEP_0184681954 /NCGR_PEP_ID=MMETSP0312-20130426/5027_1 /TAXON_ID=31354 /ORGANISM="Compsopogon coeruleus, Strain SAG 36.94" /LENGTH=201 /DNA_ID=CAMNT_0027133115 /DNA_START=86 /DNA_END=691 /DNA_ORIENTATION=-